MTTMAEDPRLVSPQCHALKPVETLHQNDWFAVRCRGGYYTVEYNQPQVTVLPVVDHRAVVMVRVKRPVIADAALELPAGGSKDNETPVETAARELAEETGIGIENLERFQRLPSVSITPRSPCLPHVFQIDISDEEFRGRTDHDAEVERVECLSFAEIRAKIADGQIYMALPAAILGRYILSNDGHLPTEPVGRLADAKARSTDDGRSKELNIELYRKMYLIRTAEGNIREHYEEDEMKTPMHMSMGGEAIAAGVCQALRREDQVLGTYRSHALYIAKTMETDRFFAEMYGKVTGTSKGKAGSMHLLAPEDGLICTSAVVASHISVGVGVAYANKLAGNGKVTAVFFGDGAVDEGSFWESMNIASLLQVPLLLVFEDNGFAVHTPKHKRQGYESLARIVAGFHCDVLEGDSTDAEDIHSLTGEALECLRRRGRPCLLGLKYYRYLEHVGVFEDFKAGYRSYEQFLEWKVRDPLELQRRKLARWLSDTEIQELERGILEQVLESWQKAKDAPFPSTDALHEDVYA